VRTYRGTLNRAGNICLVPELDLPAAVDAAYRTGGHRHPERLGCQAHSPGDPGVVGIASCRVQHQYQVRSVLGNSALNSRSEIRQRTVAQSAVGVVRNRD
jgi:hypothetical protein